MSIITLMNKIADTEAAIRLYKDAIKVNDNLFNRESLRYYELKLKILQSELDEERK